MGSLIAIVDEIRAKYNAEEKGLTIAQKTERNDSFVAELLQREPRLDKALTERLKTSKPATVMFQAYLTLKVFNLMPTKFNDFLLIEWKKSEKNVDAFRALLKEKTSFPAVHEAVDTIEIGKTFKPDDWKKDFFALVNWEDILEEVQEEAAPVEEQKAEEQAPAQEEQPEEAKEEAQDDEQIPLSDSRRIVEEPEAEAFKAPLMPSHYQAVLAPAKAATPAKKAKPVAAVEVSAKHTPKKLAKFVVDLIQSLEKSTDKEAGDAILDLIVYTVSNKKAVAEDALEDLRKVMGAYQKHNYAFYTALVSFLNSFTHIKCEEVESKYKKKTHTIELKTKALTPAFGAFFARGVLPKHEGTFFTATGEQTSGDLFLALDYFMTAAKAETPAKVITEEQKALAEAKRYIAPVIKASAPAHVVEAFKALSDDEFAKAKEHLEQLKAAIEEAEAARSAQA